MLIIIRSLQQQQVVVGQLRQELQLQLLVQYIDINWVILMVEVEVVVLVIIVMIRCFINMLVGRIQIIILIK